jgi:hypothetical protein
MNYSEAQDEELSVQYIISRTFSLYRSHYLEFITPFIFAGLISGFLSLTTYSLFPLNIFTNNAVQPDLLSWTVNNLGTLIFTIFFLSLISWALYSVVGGYAVKLTSDLFETGGSDHRLIFDRVLSNLPSLLALSLITSVLISVGFIFFVIPGIISAIVFSLSIPIIMIERSTVSDSLKRSINLVKGRWMKTFCLLLIVTILLLLVDTIVGTILLQIVPVPVNNILRILITSTMQPLYAIMTALLYHSMKIRELKLFEKLD